MSKRICLILSLTMIGAVGCSRGFKASTESGLSQSTNQTPSPTPTPSPQPTPSQPQPNPSPSPAPTPTPAPTPAPVGNEASLNQPSYIDNGVIRIEVNGGPYSDTAGMPVAYQPIITHIWVDGVEFLPHDNAGADMQMTLRDPTGDNWNPTQGGTCWNSNPQLDAVSILTQILSQWGEPNWPKTGLSVSVTPVDFGLKNGTVCAPTPLNDQVLFKMTLSPGDGHTQPAEVVNMSWNWMNASAHTIVKGGSELPIGFFRDDVARYAFFRDAGGTWQAANASVQDGGCAGSVPGNDVQQWNFGSNECLIQNHYCVALATSPNWILGEGVALAFCDKQIHTHSAFSHVASNPTFSDRNQDGQRDYNLSAMAFTADGDLTDSNWHRVRNFMIVGDHNTVEADYNWAVHGGIDFSDNN